MGSLVAALLVATSSAPASAAPVNECWPTDNGNPVLDSFTLSADVVDVTQTSQRLRIEAEAHDVGGPGPATEVTSISGYIGPVDPPPLIDLQTFSLRLTDDGTWRGSVLIPKGAPPGDWRVYTINVDDTVDNRLYLDDHVPTPEYDRTLTVTSVEDTTPPALVSLDLARTRVDTRRKVQRVAVTVRATDDLSGVAGGEVHGIFRPRDADASTRYVDARLRLRAGRLEGVLRIPTGIGNGRLRLDRLVVRDHAGYELYLYDGGLKRPRVERDIAVRSSVPPREHVEPRLVSYRRTPGPVDVRTGADSVTFTVRARDGGSGVASVQVVGERTFGTAEPPFYETRYVGGAGLRLVKGTRADGTWQGTMRLGPCRTGAGQVSLVVVITDRDGNQRYPYDDVADGTIYDDGVDVRASDHGRPTMRAEHDRQASQLVVTFSEDVNGLSTTSLPVTEARYPDPDTTLSGTWTCVDVSGTVQDCLTGSVAKATFSFAPPDPEEPYHSLILRPNPDTVLALTDLAGNPAASDGVVATIKYVPAS